MTKPWYSTKFTTNSTSSAAFTLCRRSTSACLVRGGGFRAPLLTAGELEVFQSFSCLPAFFAHFSPNRPNWWKSEVDAARGSNKHGTWTYHSGKDRGSDRPQARMKFSVIVNMRSEVSSSLLAAHGVPHSRAFFVLAGSTTPKTQWEIMGNA